MAQTPQPPEHLERLRTNLENFIKRAITKEVFSNEIGTWTSQTVATYGTLKVNKALRLCAFTYYRQNYNFSSTSEVTLHSGAIPSDYRPKISVKMAVYNPTIGAGIGTDGDIYVYTNATGTKTINGYVMWYY